MTAKESGEKLVQENYTCLYCNRIISKWNKSSGVCLRCAKYGRPQGGDINRYKSDALRGAKHYGWKEDASYDALHKWISSELGKATFCSNDETHKSKKYHWANISGEYRRDVNDYKPLCVPCHSKYDMTEHRLKMLKENSDKAKELNKKAVLQYTKDDRLVNEYQSVDEASYKTGISRKRISDSLNGWRKNVGGYSWRLSDPLQEAMRAKNATKNRGKFLERMREKNKEYRNRKQAEKLDSKIEPKVDGVSYATASKVLEKAKLGGATV